MRAHKIYEIFTEDSDPVHDMGIGLKYLKEKVKNIQLYNVLTAMREHWQKIVENTFMLPGNELYYLACNQKDKDTVENIDEIELSIKKGKKIAEKKIKTSGANNEICIFKLYMTSVGKIGTFEYKYEYKYDNNYPPDTNKQYIGTILAVLEFDSKYHLRHRL
jgi:hypothetical protein